LNRFPPASAVVGLLLAPIACPAATIRVPEDHATIQPAIDSAAPGDTVLVGPGTWQERIRLAPGIVFRSAFGPDSTTLVSPGLEEKVIDERLLEVLEGDRATVIEGFTMSAGTAPGCAIYVENASPTIRGNVIDGFGWGVNLRFSEALVEGNEIRDSPSFGILVFASSPEIRGNSLHSNPGQAIGVSGKESHPVIGGSPEASNRLYANGRSILNGSRNDIVATYNDWGWETTVEMDVEGWPADIEAIQDGNDRDRSHRGKGKVDYRNWIRPEEPAAEPTAGSPATRIALPLGVALLLVAVFVGLSRRRATAA